MKFFLDANCFKGYVDCLLDVGDKKYAEAVDCVFSVGKFASDSGELFIQEWKQTTGGSYNPFVNDLIAAWLAEGKIELLEFKTNQWTKKKLSELGVPKIDARIIDFCSGADVSFIISEDIDLFEPKAKKSDSKRMQSIKCNGTGDVAKFAKKNLKIIISCSCHIKDYVN